ncbi:hypothetical protein Q2490_14995 [Myroides odoratimimus]|uniref:hypothetical protein n=1 Tax=Myroides odoratimimus TaxID=76832 RepID=UPI002577652F|nr:hypothetical protein [Myroides odoratimimus]MDM1085784.1 hypothetical protein [Myroides odoratimimus]MDO5858590.1 hypothetical protein [Myroides odoratimimus]
MGTFLSFTYQSQGGSTKEEAIVNQDVIGYISSALNDDEWQYSLAGRLRDLEERYHHITISAIVRLFLKENIEKGKLKSFFRYVKNEDELSIDQMLDANKYDGLNEVETRVAMADDIFAYFKEIILKYKDRFLDFDAVAFIPLLEERFEVIKREEYISKRSKN